MHEEREVRRITGNGMGRGSCTCNDPLNGVLKVFLSHTCSFLPGSMKSGLIDNVSNVRSWITCESASKRIETVCV